MSNDLLNDDDVRSIPSIQFQTDFSCYFLTYRNLQYCLKKEYILPIFVSINVNRL